MDGEVSENEVFLNDENGANGENGTSASGENNTRDITGIESTGNEEPACPTNAEPSNSADNSPHEKIEATSGEICDINNDESNGPAGDDSDKGAQGLWTSVKGPYVLSGGPLIFTFSFFSQGLLVRLG